MPNNLNDLNEARNEVSASSAGGAAFLIAYGTTFLVCGLLSLFLTAEIAALVAMFQGGLALPAAFWLERRLGTGTMAPDNPLRSLSVQLAMSQTLGLPALIVAYSLNPRSVPVVLAALGGMHFMPYAWLQRTQAYIVLGVAVSIGAFLIQALLPQLAFHAILFYVGVVYWISAAVVYRAAKRLVPQPAG
jgi:hypothetical protein